MDLESFLQEKGYEIGTDGSKYFSMLLENVIYALEEKIPKEFIKHQVIPSSVDYYYRFHTISKKKYLDAMDEFRNSQIIDGNKISSEEELDHMLLRLGKIFIKENNQENTKYYQKCKTK